MCFGFVFAGPSYQSFAQAPEARSSERNQSREKKRDGETALEVFAASLGDLYKITSELAIEKGRRSGFGFEYFVTVKPNGVSSQSARGGDGSLEWSGKFREPLHALYDAFLPRVNDWDENFLVEFRVDKDTVTLKATVLNYPDTPAASLASFEQGLGRKKVSGDANFIRSQIYQASKVTVDKNKIIVVASLPRAGLESLLTKDAR